MTNIRNYPQGSIAGEPLPSHVSIKDQVWYLLHKDSKFKDHWHNKEPLAKRKYHLTVCCLTRGLTEKQMLTVLWIWHRKHGLTFDEADFWENLFPKAAEYAEPKVMKYRANEYWKEIRRIAFDTKTRQHSKLRVAYFLMNTKQATARAIHEATDIPLKTVRNCLTILQRDGKIEMKEFGIYRAFESLHWDRATMIVTPEGSYIWDDEHPAMYLWGQTINERLEKNGMVAMLCYDYCQDKAVRVLYDRKQKFNTLYAHPDRIEWVINDEGNVVENGTGLAFLSLLPEFDQSDLMCYVNGDRYDCRSSNVCVSGKKKVAVSQDEDVDYWSRLIQCA